MIVDAHVHVGAWAHPDFLARESTMEELVAVLGDAGIVGACVMPTDGCDNAGLLTAAEEALTRGFPGALWLVAWVRPVAGAGSPGAADLAWLDAHRHEVAGIKLHPSLSRVAASDAQFAPFLEIARARHMPVLVHCGRWQEMASYRIAIELALAHPHIRFVLAHAGGDTAPLATAAAEMVRERRADNVWFDIAGLREYWVVERCVARVGAERYLFGSDYNLAHPRMYLGAVAGMRLGERDRERILGDNARELYGAPLLGALSAPR
jgi:hypothetical protein